MTISCIEIPELWAIHPYPPRSMWIMLATANQLKVRRLDNEKLLNFT